jgi:hypothetical protein
MPENTAVVAFIYDRRIPLTPGLRDRLQTCGTYAYERGWEIGGWHIDTDPLDGARPALEAALRVLERADPARRRVLLVAAMDCLSDQPPVLLAMMRRVTTLGGEVLAVDTAPVEAAR